MIDQPELSVYYSNIANYEQFLALCIGIGLIIAYFVIKHVHAQPWAITNGLEHYLPSLWVIVALGAILRIPTMLQVFWYDEAFTSVLTSVPLPNMAIAITGDVHPPLYYVIVRLFTAILGHNDIAMRLPAYLSGIALIVVMHHLGTINGVGKTTALITAIMPSVIYYSTEARYPMFLALMLAIAYLSLLSKRSIDFGFALVGATLVHVNAWIYVVVLCGLWLWRYRSAYALILPAFAIAIWFPVALVQAQDVSDGFWLTQYLPVRHLIEMTIGSRFDDALVMFVPAITLSTIIFASVWMYRKQISWRWLAMVALVPAIQSFAGIIWHPIYLPRTLIFSSLLLLIPVAIFINRYPVRWLTTLAPVAIFIAIGALYINDRNGTADDAIALCDGYPTIYATNVHSAILASHFSDVEVRLYPGGNSTAQQLPSSAQRALFDDVDLLQANEDVCIYSQVSVFNSPDEIAYLDTIINRPRAHSYIITQNAVGYYLVSVLEVTLDGQ